MITGRRGWAALAAPFLAAPAASAVLVDFDGTLAPIVADPAAAAPDPGAVRTLHALAGRYGVVAVISGRPAAFLAHLFRPPIVVAGLYGLQLVRDGVPVDHPDAEAWRPVIDEVVAATACGPSGMGVEPKGLSITLHYRAAPDLEPQVREWAAAQAARTGLQLRDARMSVELHPPVAADKGTVVEALAGGRDHVLYIGDDLGDLPAYDALDRLAASGARAVRGAVIGPRGRPELLARADVRFADPAEVVAFLALLAG